MKLDYSIKDIVKPRTTPQRKVLLAPASSYLCRVFAENLRNDDEYLGKADYLVAVGQAQSKDLLVVPFVRNETTVMRLALDAGLVILDLANGGSEVAMILKVLLLGGGTRDQHLVCLSTPYAWANTMLFQKQEAVKQNRTNVSDSIDEADSKLKGSRLILPSMYKQREPNSSYYYVHQLEDMAIKIAGKQGVTVNVIVPGLVYGGGEFELYPLFRDAFNNKPIKCSEQSRGNVVPLVSLEEYTHFVLEVVQKRPKGQLFLFVNEGNVHNTKEQILNAVSETVQGCKVTIEKANYLKDRVESDYFKELNLSLGRTVLSEVNHMEEPKEPRFFKGSIQKVVAEYLRLRPFRTRQLALVGGSEKERKQFFDRFRELEVVTERKVLQPQNPELKQQIAREREQIQRDKLLLEQIIKKKKKPEGENLKKELSRELIVALLTAAVSTMAGKYKGYILDNLQMDWVEILNPEHVLYVLPEHPVLPHQPEQQKEQVSSLQPIPPQTLKDLQTAREQKDKEVKKDAKKEKEREKEKSPQQSKYEEDMQNYNQVLRGSAQWQARFAPILKRGTLQELLAALIPASQEPQARPTEQAARVLEPNAGEEEERKKTDKKSLNAQQYIMDNVLPAIAECLLQLGTKEHERPVEQFLKLLRGKAETFRIVDPFAIA